MEDVTARVATARIDPGCPSCGCPNGAEHYDGCTVIAKHRRDLGEAIARTLRKIRMDLDLADPWSWHIVECPCFNDRWPPSELRGRCKRISYYGLTVDLCGQCWEALRTYAPLTMRGADPFFERMERLVAWQQEACLGAVP